MMSALLPGKNLVNIVCLNKTHMSLIFFIKNANNILGGIFMVIVLNPNATSAQINELTQEIEKEGCTACPTVGRFQVILGVVGDTSRLDQDRILIKDYVEKVLKIQEPYKKANRSFHPENSVIQIGNESIGGKKLGIIAGPCSVESEEQIVAIAKQVKAAGASFLRGGAYKPRTSPYSFQGLKEEGLDLLKIAREETGLPIVSELMAISTLDRFVQDVDIIQIGARNMQNFDLLKELGQTNKPILLKRGLSATIEEWLMSAEYIMAEGNENVILCERGIRTFETYTRNTLDLSAVLAIKKLSHLPVMIDPSHAAGKWWMVESLSKAAVAVGADGLIIEVHNDPANAKCDGSQSIKPERFEALMQSLGKLARIENRTI
jgi:3-deoxy-7-phosphoheptulonate synthase